MPTHLQKHLTCEQIAVPRNRKLLFINVGEPNRKYRIYHINHISFHTHRAWEDCLKFGFISAGQFDTKYLNIPGKQHLYSRWVDQIKSVDIGDIICAYVTEVGFVGIGECMSNAVPIAKLQLQDGSFLFDHSKEIYNQNILKTKANVNEMGFSDHIPNTFGCEDEFAFAVKWIRTITKKEAENTNQNNKRTLGITQHVVSNMNTQARSNMKTYVEEVFNVKFI